MSTPNFLQHVRLKNFRSIRECDVALGPLTFLVGPNGSGKSNFVDALRFVSEALSTSLENAVNSRGGYNELRRKPGKNVRLEIELVFSLAEEACFETGRWELALRSSPPGGYQIASEVARCPYGSADRIQETRGLLFGSSAEYSVARGKATWDLGSEAPSASSTRLYLTACSGLAPFGLVDDAFRSIACHNLNPHRMREPQPPGPAVALAPDGANICAMVHRLKDGDPRAFPRIMEYMGAIVPGLCDIRRAPAGPYETLRFSVTGPDGKPVNFYSAQMSDGTLRALACLVALHGGPATEPGCGSWLVALEEPETAIHPGAVRVLLDAIREASLTRQVIVTTHSPDLIDHPDITADEIRAVTLENGETVISGIDDVGRDALHDGLYTAGELQRLGQLVAAGRPHESGMPHE